MPTTNSLEPADPDNPSGQTAYAREPQLLQSREGGSEEPRASAVPELTEDHRRQLEASAISVSVAAERGYRTVARKADMQRLGFSNSQRRVPALLIPVYGVAGEIVTYQARPTEPRVVNGKALKYETPLGSRMALDVPRRVLDQLADPSVPLWI